MTSNNLKSCKKDLDCEQNEICQLTYKKDSKEGILKPIGRFCKLKDNFQSNENNNQPKKQYSNVCNEDAECISGICEKQFDNLSKDGNPQKMCVKQNKMYGKRCLFNHECEETGRCVNKETGKKKIFEGKFCLVYENKEDFIFGGGGGGSLGGLVGSGASTFGGLTGTGASTFGGLPGSGDSVLSSSGLGGLRELGNNPIKDPMPDKFLSKEWNATRDETIFFTKAQKDRDLKGRGVLSRIVILIIEFICEIISKIFYFLIFIAQSIFNFITSMFNSILGNNFFLFSRRFEQDEHFRDAVETIKCNKKSHVIKKKTMLKIITLFIPPYGVFLHKGLKGSLEIIICSILTLMFYLPGVFYGFSVIDS